MSELNTTLDEILLDKNTNLLPENLKQGVTCLGVNGSLNVKQEYLGYNTLEDLNAEIDNPNIEIGQKAVLYGPNKIPLEIDNMFNVIIKLGKTFTLTEEQKTYISTNGSVSAYSSTDYDSGFGTVQLYIYSNYAEFRVTRNGSKGYTLLARYESTDGLIYTGLDEYTSSGKGGGTKYTFTYENINSGSVVYNEQNKTDSNSFAYDILKSLLKSVGIVKLQGVYQYTANISNSYKIQYLMNMSYSNSITNGNTTDFVYTEKAYNFIKEKYNLLDDHATSTSEIMTIDTIDENKNVIAGDIYIYPSSISTFLLVQQDNSVSACFRHDNCKKYHFDVSNNTFTFVGDILNDGVKAYRGSYDEYTLQIITPINNDKKVITSNNMGYAYVYEGTYYQAGKYLSYSYPTQYSSQYQILPTQFTITQNDVDNVIGSYVMLGKDGEVATNNTWTKAFDTNKYKQIMPYLDLTNRLSLSYNLNTCNLPELSTNLNTQLGNLKYSKLTDLTNNYLQYGVIEDCKKQYGFSYIHETLQKIDVTSVPHMDEFDGYFYQANEHLFIDNTGLVHLLYTSTRNKYAFYFEINPETGEYTSKQIETAGDDIQFAQDVGDYWCIISADTYNSSTQYIRQMQVVEKQTGNITDTFSVDFSGKFTNLSNWHGIKLSIWFEGDIPSSSTFRCLALGISSSSGYTYKLYKYTSATDSVLVASDSTSRNDIGCWDLTKNQCIMRYKTTSADPWEYHVVWPTDLAKQVYNTNQIHIPDGYQYSYTLTEDTNGTRYTIINNIEVDTSTIEEPKETFKIDNIEYYKPAIQPGSDGYDCKLEIVETGEIKTIAIPSSYYNLTTYNSYQYVSDPSFDTTTDDLEDGRHSYISITRYKFTGYQANIIVDDTGATDLICLFPMNNKSSSSSEITSAYLISTDNLQDLISSDELAKLVPTQIEEIMVLKKIV